tara:strand:- start:209 stop:919 length:711 start_codon:yes stop_codon:yes gene_type:complete
VTDATEALTVLYAEDDERLAELTAKYLTMHGIIVHRVGRGDEVLAELGRVKPDVVLLDLMLPGTDGQTVCRQIRERSHVPIVMVTALGEEADRVLGLEGGADDYVTKPFSSRELLARVRAQARRARGEAGPSRRRVVVGDLEVDAETMTATLAGRELDLTTYEHRLLHALAERAGRVLGRERLIELVTGSPDEAFDRSIDVHVSRLRQKLGDDSRKPRILKTVRGVGYMLAAERPA